MSVVIVLLLLVLGYRYTNAVPYEKALLKRSTGWETYAILARYGLFFGITSLIFAILIMFLILILAFLIFSLLHIFYPTTIEPYVVWQEAFKAYRALESFEVLGTKGIPFIIILLILSWFACEGKIEQNKNKGLDQLKTQDSFLNIVLTAMDEQIPVKIALKSRKVYVGTVLDEQFEQANFDNISIVPHLSGYRDKDTLKVNFDCNYSEIYKKRNIQETQIEPLSNQKSDKKTSFALADFRLNIKVSEIESISLFYQEIFEDFNPTEPSPTIFEKIKELF